MKSRDFLTASELLKELADLGQQLEPRTLRFWTSKGLLPKLVKKPFRGADGRVGYYPRSALATIDRIRALQAEGWKIKQIAERLKDPEAKTPQPQNDQAKFFAEKYLESLLAGQSKLRLRTSHYARANVQNETAILRQDLVSRLERMVPRKVAVTAASSFLLSLTENQRKRLVRRLRLAKNEELSPDIEEPKIGDHFDRATLSQVQNILSDWPILNQADDRQPVTGRRAKAITESLRDCVESYLSSSSLGQKALTEKMSAHLEELRKTSQQLSQDLAYLRETDAK